MSQISGCVDGGKLCKLAEVQGAQQPELGELMLPPARRWRQHFGSHPRWLWRRRGEVGVLGGDRLVEVYMRGTAVVMIHRSCTVRSGLFPGLSCL